MNRPPCPPTRHEVVRRANEALPAGVRISYRPRQDGRRALKPYVVLVQEEEVARAASIEAAVFSALRQRADLRLPDPEPRTW